MPNNDAKNVFESLDGEHKQMLSLDASNYNKYEGSLKTLLSLWHQVSMDKNIEYMIAYGTLLGYRRTKQFIPWDTDIDVVLNKNAFDTIYSLVNDPTMACFIKRSDLLINSLDINRMKCLNYLKTDLKFNYSAKYNSKYTRNIPFIVLINEENKKYINKRQRYHCWKKIVINESNIKEADKCSFLGPFGRLYIYSNDLGQLVYMDIFGYFHKQINLNSNFDMNSNVYKRGVVIDGCGEWADAEGVNYGLKNNNSTWCSEMIDDVAQSFEFETIVCQISNVDTICPKYEEDIDTLLTESYGPNFMTPGCHWNQTFNHWDCQLIL